MRDGMYGITFHGPSGGMGIGILILNGGRVYGTDQSGLRYDGDYAFDETSKLVSMKLTITFPPNVESVFGLMKAHEWSFEVTAEFDPTAGMGEVQVTTSIGQSISAQYAFLRDLPEWV